MITIKTKEQFEEKVACNEPTIVFFSGGAGCQKCVMGKRNIPLIEDRLPETLICYVDVNDVQEVFEQYQVTHYPVLAIFKDGKMVANRSGVGMPENICDWYEATVSVIIPEEINNAR